MGENSRVVGEFKEVVVCIFWSNAGNSDSGDVGLLEDGF
jgi:hypothetical protein